MNDLSASNDQLPATTPQANKPAPTTTIGKLESTMDTMAYEVLMDLFNWATLWDDIYNERCDKLTEARQRAMLRPFTGFGPHPTIWAQYSTALVPLINSDLLAWMADAQYRKANSAAWLILQRCAPALAAQSKGYESGHEAHRILREAGGVV